MKLYVPEVKIKGPNFKSSGAWFSGFFEGDGCVMLNYKNYEININVSQKSRYMLDKIKGVYGGSIARSKSSNCHSWRTSNKKDLVKLFEYFTLYPLQSKKTEDLSSGIQLFRYKLLGYHLDSLNHLQLDSFIDLFREKREAKEL